jgi:uncharacterized protein (TIGR02145 family)
MKSFLRWNETFCTLIKNIMRGLLLNIGLTAMMLCSVSFMHAQVTMGALNAPQDFSSLELISQNTRGLRLPQLTQLQRDTIDGTAGTSGISAIMLASRNAFDAEKTGKAKGLQIFNTTTKCVNTWNGTEWINECYTGVCVPPPAPTPAASQTFCAGATVANLTPAPNSAIKWYNSLDVALTGSDALTNGATYYCKTVSGACESEKSNDVTVTVYSAFTAGVIASTGQTVCAGGTPTVIGSTTAASGGDGTITYQWKKDNVVISGATAATYTPPTADAATAGSHTYTREAHDATCQASFVASTGSWALTVNALPSAPTPAASQTFCAGATVANLTPVPSATIKWYNSSDVAMTGSEALTNGATYYCRTVSGDCLSAKSNDVTVTVYSAFTAGAIATTGQTLCAGGTPTVIGSTTAASGGNGTITYQWKKDGSVITGATLATYTPPTADAATAGSHTYTREAHDATCQTSFVASTGSWVLTVRSAFTAGAIATTGQTLCAGGTPTVIGSTTAASGGDGTITYQWKKDGSVITSATAATYTPPTADAATAGATHTYTREAHDGACQTPFVASTGSWVLTVRPAFTAGAIATTGQTLCAGGTPTVIGSTTAASGGDGTITYQWKKDGSVITGATAATYTPPTADAATAGATHTYTREAHDGACQTSFVASTGSWVLTVNSVPAQPSTISGSTSVCSGASLTYSVTNVSGVTYTWVLPSGWTQTAGGTTNSITVTAGTSGGTITVTPSNSCGNGTARTLAVTVDVTVPSAPTITISSKNFRTMRVGATVTSDYSNVSSSVSISHPSGTTVGWSIYKIAGDNANVAFTSATNGTSDAFTITAPAGGTSAIGGLYVVAAQCTTACNVVSDVVRDTIAVGCGAMTSSSAWLKFLCHNLGADYRLDPFTLVADIHGGKYKWGTGSMALPQSMDQMAGYSTVISTWSDIGGTPPTTTVDWDMTTANPCPTGWRVPTQAEWTAVGSNNTKSLLGTYNNSATNFGFGVKMGKYLVLPASGYRNASDGILNYRGDTGYYWTSKVYDSAEAYYLYFNNYYFFATAHSSKSSGMAVRCVAQ